MTKTFRKAKTFVAVLSAVAILIGPLQVPTAHARPRQEHGKLVLEKIVRGGSLSFDVFTFEVDGGHFSSRGRFKTSDINEYANVSTGTYSVSVDASKDYATSFGGDCDESGDVTVSSRETSTCIVVVTHDSWEEPEDDGEGAEELGVGGALPETGILLIEKVIVGGDATYADFSFLLDEDEKSFWDAGVNSYVVNEGSHVVAELPTVEGYFPWYSEACDELGNVVVSSFEVVTCTITNTFSVGGFNGELPPEPGLGGDHMAVSNIGSSGDDGVSQDSLPEGTPPSLETASSSEDVTAVAAVGSLSGIVPCSVGHIGWLIANIILLVIILMTWKDRRDSHWLATILLVVAALGMNSWATTCGFGFTWLPALLSLVSWLLMKLLGRS